MADAIRTVYIGRESIEGTLATTSMKNLPFLDGGVGLNFGRIIPNEHNGTRIKARIVRRGVSTSDFMLKVHGYFDLLGYAGLASALNAPVDAAVSMAAGAFDHTFKAGGAAVPTYSIQFDQGTDWWQILGASVDSWSVAITADKLPEWTFNFVGRAAAKISAPGAIAQSIAAYSQPWDIPQASVLLAGGAYADLVSAKIDVKNGREVLHTIGSPSMRRAMEGEVVVTLDLVALYLAYTGSIVEDYLLNTSPGALVITYTSTDLIGTGTPVAVKAVITIPAPLITSAEPDPKNITTLQNIKATAGYDAASATNLIVLLRNEVASYPGS